MEGSAARYMIVGDIGGTNCRLNLMQCIEGKSPKHVFERRYKSQDLPSFPAALKQFIEESELKDTSLIKCAVIGIAGPVFGGQLLFQLNIKNWCPIREHEVQQATGIERVVLLNDFVANGYGVLDLEDREVKTLYEPEEKLFDDDQVRVVMGIGTGLGSCLLSRAPSIVKGVPGNYHVNSMDAGMIMLPTFDEVDRQYQDFLA